MDRSRRCGGSPRPRPLSWNARSPLWYCAIRTGCWIPRAGPDGAAAVELVALTHLWYVLETSAGTNDGTESPDGIGSNAAAGLTVFFIAAPALLAPLAGLLVDRVRRRPLLIVVNLALAAAILPLLVVADASRVWAVMVGYDAGRLLISSGQAALLPGLVDGHLLGHANSALSLIQNGARLLAPLAGSGLFAAFGAHAVVLLDAATALMVGSGGADHQTALGTARIRIAARGVEAVMVELPDVRPWPGLSIDGPLPGGARAAVFSAHCGAASRVVGLPVGVHSTCDAAREHWAGRRHAGHRRTSSACTRRGRHAPVSPRVRPQRVMPPPSSLSVQRQRGPQCRVDRSHLRYVQAAGERPEAGLRIHDGQLLDQDSRGGIAEVDLRAEGRGAPTGRCRRDEPGRQGRSSDWTTTAYRGPVCSWPRVSRGARSR